MATKKKTKKRRRRIRREGKTEGSLVSKTFAWRISNLGTFARALLRFHKILDDDVAEISTMLGCTCYTIVARNSPIVRWWAWLSGGMQRVHEASSIVVSMTFLSLSIDRSIHLSISVRTRFVLDNRPDRFSTATEGN